MLLDEIIKNWEVCRSTVEQERLWRHLMRPNGLWYSACCEVAQSSHCADNARILLADKQLDSLLNFSIIANKKTNQPTPEDFLQLAILLQNNGFENSVINKISVSNNLSAGSLQDIALRLFSKPIRPSEETINVTALLIDQNMNSVPVILTLDVLTDGLNAIYPAPEFSLCRDLTFMTAELVACSTNKELLNNNDIRWSIKRMDGQDTDYLSGASIGAAISVGIRILLTSSEQSTDIDLQTIALSAAITSEQTFSSINHLWNKLKLDDIRLANLHTIVVAQEQDNIPPQYLAKDSIIQIVRAKNIDHAIEQLSIHALCKKAIRGYERRECQQLEFRLPGTNMPLKSHFQPLPLSCDALRIPSNKTIDILLDNTKKTKHWLLLGPPGCGKSTLLVYLAWVATSRHQPIFHFTPARIRLRAWESWESVNPETQLYDYLSAHYSKVVNNAPNADQWKRYLNQGRVLLLLDGLDEVKDTQWYLEKHRQLAVYNTTTIIMTCRISNYAMYSNNFTDYLTCQIGSLSNRQTINYIKNYPARQGINHDALIKILTESDSLNDLAKNPLLLSIICYSADIGEQNFEPTTRTAMYHQLLEQLLERPARVDITYPSEPPTVHDKLTILGRIALRLFANKKLSFSESELEKILSDALEHEGYRPVAPWVSAFLKDFFNNSGILRHHKQTSEFTAKTCFFLHSTIQEYLCAFILNGNSYGKTLDTSIEIALEQKMFQEFSVKVASKDPHWSEVVTMLKEIMVAHDI